MLAWSFQSLCRGEASATHYAYGYVVIKTKLFQSLCRGEASATVATAADIIDELGFQSLCRGEASATTRWTYINRENACVSIPLSRGSLCNSMTGRLIQNCLQLFQSLCRGEASATLHFSMYGSSLRKFQSLCRGEASATPFRRYPAFTGLVSIPLSRGSLCNRAVVEALITNGYKRLFF